jgi:hypothetical protein
VFLKQITETRQRTEQTWDIIKLEAVRYLDSRRDTQWKVNHSADSRVSLVYDGTKNPGQPAKENAMQIIRSSLIRAMTTVPRNACQIRRSVTNEAAREAQILEPRDSVDTWHFITNTLKTNNCGAGQELDIISPIKY